MLLAYKQDLSLFAHDLGFEASVLGCASDVCATLSELVKNATC